MFRPERMASVSIICLKRDIDKILEALNRFGEFHVETAVETEPPTDFNQSIQKVEEALTNVNGLISQLNIEKTEVLDVFRLPKLAKMQVTAENWQTLLELISREIEELKQKTERVTASLAALRENSANLTHIQNMLTILRNMDADIATMDELRLIHIAIACVPSKNIPDLDKALTGYPLVFHRCYLSKATEFVCLALPSKHVEAVEKILKTHNGEIFQIPKDLPRNVTDALKQVSKQLEVKAQKEKEIQECLWNLGVSNRNKLNSLKETMQNILFMLDAKRKIQQAGRLAAIKGFTPKKRFSQLKEKVAMELNGNVLVLQNKVAAHEDPPTKISNSRFVKPFEEITKLYGLPHYDELDPTPFIAVTFPIIFGLMFGDLGHGLILAIGGLTLGFLIKKQSAIKNMCWILAACGVGTIFAGLLFGEFFGRQVFAPLWFNPFDNVLTFLVFSLFIGVAQILSGLILEMVNFATNKNFQDVLLTSVPKIAFYMGSVYLITTYQLNFGVWFTGPILFSLVPFFVLVFGKPAFHAGLRISQRAGGAPINFVSFTERLFESGDLVTRLLSNTVSYSRILALLMAHWAFILVTYIVAGLAVSNSVLGLIVSSLVIVVGNMVVIGLEGLVVFIHTLRLHFYEWFSKFYGGNGTPFKPFKQSFVYTEVVIGKKEQKR